MNSINPFWQNTETSVAQQYLDVLSLIERLHRLLLDVIKDEFERLGGLEINAVQALLLFNIGENEVTAGELKSRGYYHGSNVSYNLKKLVDLGYMHHQRCEMDRRSVRVKLTAKGRDIKDTLSQLFVKHADILETRADLSSQRVYTITKGLNSLYLLKLVWLAFWASLHFAALPVPNIFHRRPRFRRFKRVAHLQKFD